MLFSRVIDAMKEQMTAIIVRDSEGFFDDSKWGEDLQITVRVACEFLFSRSCQTTFLNWERPSTWLEQSIQEWIGFFSMAQTGRILIGLKLQSGFGPKLPSTFSELKASYDSTFHQVLESTHSIKAMGLLLLSLVQLMFLFMTVYFPSFLSFSSENRSD